MHRAIRYFSLIALHGICALFVVSILALPAAAQTLPPELITAREKWEEYFHKVMSIEGSVRIQTMVDGTAQQFERTSSFAVEGNSGFSHAQYTSPRGITHVVEGVNPNYLFDLLSRDARGKNWEQQRFDWDPVTLNSTDTLRRFIGRSPTGENRNAIDSAMQNILSGLRVEFTWFPFVIRAPSFHVVNIESLHGDDAGLVRIEFRYQPKKPEPGNMVRSGEVLLDSNRYWLIRRGKVKVDFGQNDGGVDVAIQNIYDDGNAGLPLIKSQENRWINKDASGKSMDVRQMETFDLKPITDDARKYFYLSGYDMSEHRRPSVERAYWWIGHGLGVVAAGIVAAFALRWWSRRNAKSPTKPPSGD
jgi:hypothetical protein